MILLPTFPAPIERMPGFLMSAISPEASKGATLLGSMNLVQRHLEVAAIALNNPSEAEPKEVHSLLYPRASKPKGPVATSVCGAADLMQRPSIESKKHWMNLRWVLINHEARICRLTMRMLVNKNASNLPQL